MMSTESMEKEYKGGSGYMHEEVICENFNRQWPIGSEVIMINDTGEAVETQIRGKAIVHASGPCIQLHGVTGIYHLSRVIPINHEYSTDSTTTNPYRWKSHLANERTNERTNFP